MNLLPPLFIFDLDGTIADQTHRRPLLAQGDWVAYFEACNHDTPIKPVCETMERLYWSGAEIWVWSGRSDRVRDKTLAWLFAHTYMSPRRVTEHFLTMRRAGDVRADDIIKQEMLDNMLDVDRQRLVATFDDRDRVVAMWRRNGIQCFQVAPGDF